MPEFIDTHCHLDAAEFDPDRDAVAERARAAGVETQVIPAIARFNFDAVLDCCRRYPGCLPALGLHPLYIGSHRPEHLEQLRRAVEASRPVAIGEIGLDFFVPELDPEIQRFFFSEQLRIARDFDLPVLLHVRRAIDPILALLRRMPVKGGIAHAFNGSRQQAGEFIKLGFRLGFGGAMTWDRALKLRELARTLPLSAMVLETDAPDIPPMFLGGRERNAPEYLPRIAQTLAELRGLSLETVAEATTRSARETLAI